MRPAREVYNLVRGCDPQPGAFADLSGRRLRMYEPRLETVASASEPGTILSIEKDAMRVRSRAAPRCSFGRVRLEPDGKKTDPAELAASGALRAGAKLKKPTL